MNAVTPRRLLNVPSLLTLYAEDETFTKRWSVVRSAW